MTAPTPIIRTVRGDVPAAGLGAVAFHEHLLFDLVRPGERHSVEDPPIDMHNRWQVDYRSNENRNNARQRDAGIAGRELSAFARDGGTVLVDQTTYGIGRDPLGQLAASEAAGLHVVAAAGTYVAAYLEPELLALDTAALTDRFVAEVQHGMDGTPVRAGLIGEIGTSWPIEPVERHALEAAAAASRRTGAAISVHPGRHPDAPFAIVDILQAAGAELSRTVICHMDRTFPRGERVRDLLETGVCVEWDFFGIEQSHYWFGDVELPTDLQRLHLIRSLMDAGFADRILVSHDICTCTRMIHWGGHGYGHLMRNGPELMRRAGFSPPQIDQLLRRNPLRLLTLADPIVKQD